jgi:hypothetical protein
LSARWAFIAFCAFIARVALSGEAGVETAGAEPNDSTRISGRSLPVASLIFAFWASVNLILTSLLIDSSFSPSGIGKKKARRARLGAEQEIPNSQ